MRNALFLLALVALPACDFLPTKNRSVVLNGTVLDAETRQPLGGIRWTVNASREVGSVRSLTNGVTAPDGTFRAQYGSSCCDGITLEVNNSTTNEYKNNGQALLARSGTITLTILLEKKLP